METGEDPEGSTWDWARRRTRERLRGLFIPLIAIPIGSAVLGALVGPPKRASVLEHVWWAAWPFVAALVVVALGTALVSLYFASFEQKSALVVQSGAQRLRVTELEAQLSSEPVNAEHAATIKRILETAMSAVRSGSQIPFAVDTDKSVIVGHFNELKPLLDEWDNLAYEATLREHQLDDRFDSTMNTLALGPPFARAAFKKFLDIAKKMAKEQSRLPYVISWRGENDDDDIHFPNLVMTREGFSVAEVDPTKMALTREAIRMRTQQFVNQMFDWEELREYGDLTKVREHDKCQRDLLAKLKFRAEQDGYVRGSGCPRCPQS
jgi:hypothetical protein